MTQTYQMDVEMHGLKVNNCSSRQISSVHQRNNEPNITAATTVASSANSMKLIMNTWKCET